MKKLEFSLVVFVVISVGLNLLLIPGAGVITILSLASLSMLYQFFSFALFNNVGFSTLFKKESYKGLKAIRIIAPIGLGWVLSMSLLGVLFKIQSFPGSQVLLLVSNLFMIMILIISLYKFVTTRTDFYLGVCKRVTPMGLVVLLFVNISGISWVKFKYRNYPEYIELYEKMLSDPDNKEIQFQLEMKRMNLNNPDQ